MFITVIGDGDNGGGNGGAVDLFTSGSNAVTNTGSGGKGAASVQEQLVSGGNGSNRYVDYSEIDLLFTTINQFLSNDVE